MQVYASDPFSYDFKAALNQALTPPEKPIACLTAEQRYWRTQFSDAPTREDLRKHAERFGSECVQEIADACGIDLTGSTPVRRSKRVTASKSRRGVQRAKEALA